MSNINVGNDAVRSSEKGLAHRIRRRGIQLGALLVLLCTTLAIGVVMSPKAHAAPHTHAKSALCAPNCDGAD